MNHHLKCLLRFLIVLSVAALVLEITSCATPNGDNVQKAANVGVVENAVNINTASPTELEALPGIGETLAKRIVEYRDKNGKFRKPEYLLLVPGVSERRFRQIRNRIRID